MRFQILTSGYLILNYIKMVEREYFIGTQDELLDYINEWADIGYYVADITEICVMVVECWKQKNLYFIEYLWWDD